MMPRPIFGRADFISSLVGLTLIFISMVLQSKVLGAYWEHSLEYDSHHHHDHYHERFDEAAIRNEEERRHHQEEYAEYATRYISFYISLKVGRSTLLYVGSETASY